MNVPPRSRMYSSSLGLRNCVNLVFMKGGIQIRWSELIECQVVNVGDLVNVSKFCMKEAGDLGDACHEILQNRSPIFWLNGQAALAFLLCGGNSGFGVGSHPNIGNSDEITHIHHLALKQLAPSYMDSPIRENKVHAIAETATAPIHSTSWWNIHKKLLLDTPQLAGGRKGASPRSGLNLVFFDA